MKSLGLTTSFQPLGDKERERIERKGFELVRLGERGNGVVVSNDWDPSRPTVLFCHGRSGSAGSSGYMNIPQEIGKYKFGGACNLAIVLHQAPGDQNTMVGDGLDAVDYLTSGRGDKNIRLCDLHLAGYSIGCITASALATSFPDAARLTLLLPPTDMPEATAHTLTNRGLGSIRKFANWTMSLVNGNHRSTVDYIAQMHANARARGLPDVMPVEALLSEGDKVADPDDFLRGLEQRGIRDVVHVAREPMHNSPTNHTHAFSLERNFPQLMDSDVLHENSPRVPPVRPLPAQGISR